MSCLCLFRAKNKLESHKKVCDNKDFCNIVMSSENNKILVFNQYQKSDKVPFIIYTYLPWLMEKIDGCKNNPENSSTTKVGKDIPLGFLMSTICSFKSIWNKHDIYRGKDYMKIFCIFLREHAVEILSFEKKKNETINKRTAGIILKCKNLLYSQRKM